MPGQKVVAVFGFCDIRQFTGAWGGKCMLASGYGGIGAGARGTGADAVGADVGGGGSLVVRASISISECDSRANPVSTCIRWGEPRQRPAASKMRPTHSHTDAVGKAKQVV
jgi:hypothetical protein